MVSARPGPLGRPRTAAPERAQARMLYPRSYDADRVMCIYIYIYIYIYSW